MAALGSAAPAPQSGSRAKAGAAHSERIDKDQVGVPPKGGGNGAARAAGDDNVKPPRGRGDARWQVFGALCWADPWVFDKP